MNPARGRFLLRALLSVGLFALLLSRVHWRELAVLLRNVRPAPLLVGWLFGGICPLLMAARTRLMLGQWKIGINYREALGLTWLGQFCNIFLPGGGGDVVKFYRINRLAPGAKAAGVAGLLADRILALIALLALAGVVTLAGDHRLLYQLAGGVDTRCWIMGLALAVAGALAGVIAWSRRGALANRLTGRVRRVAGSFTVGLRLTPGVGIAFLLAVLVHIFSLASCYLLCVSLQIPATFTQIVLVWPVVMIAAMLPLSVNGHGLREYILLYYFEHWWLVSAMPGSGGIPETVLALSLLTVMTDTFWGLPGGLCLLGGSATQDLDTLAEPAPPRSAFPVR